MRTITDKKDAREMKLREDDIYVIHDASVGENDGYQYNVKFLSLEGEDIVWQKSQAEQLKQQILENQRLRELVEKRIEVCKNNKEEISVKDNWKDFCNQNLEKNILQSLLDKAKEKEA